MKLNIDVTFLDGSTVTAKVLPRAVVAFERQYGVPVSALSESPHLEHLCYLAWAALHPKQFEGTFEKFLDAIETVDGEGEGEGEDDAPKGGQADPFAPSN